MSEATTASKYDKTIYIERLAASKGRAVATMGELLSWVNKLDAEAAEHIVDLEPFLDIFPVTRKSEYVRTVFDIHTSPQRYGALGISLKSQGMRKDLSTLSKAELFETFRRYCSADEAKKHALSYLAFQALMDRISALKFLGVDFPKTTTGGAVLPRWFDAVRDYGQLCSKPLEEAFKRFIELGNELDELISDFNSFAGPIRYRAIRCSYTLDESDPLGPSNPELKVSITKAQTVRRRYNLMPEFKRQLRRARVRDQLEYELGRAPDKAEIDAGMSKLRNRKPTPWLTNEVIKACYLGRRSKDLLETQSKLVAVMEPWSDLRMKLQALL